MSVRVLILSMHDSARRVLAEGMPDHWAKQLGRDWPQPKET